MVNTEIRLIIFFAAKDGEALYNQQKYDWELTVVWIMNSFLRDQCREIEENNRMGKTRDLFKKPREYLMQRWAQ